jgi:calcineurin-like phosphoesterase family protein
MNEDFVSRWNSKIKPEDTVYHLGNFIWDPLIGSEYLQILNGKIILIPTQNDKASIELSKIAKKHLIIKDEKIVELPEFGIVMSHYPHEDWNGKDLGIIHLHGGKTEIKTDLSVSRRINCSVDLWDYYPVEINAILDFVKDFEAIKK